MAKWDFCCDGPTLRIRSASMPTITLGVRVTCINHDSKVFRFKTTAIFTPFAVRLSVIRCGRDWSIIQKTGNMAPCSVGISYVSRHHKSSRLGQCPVFRTGSLASMIRFRKRNWRRCGVVPFVGVLLDRPSGLKRLLRRLAHGRHSVRLVVPKSVRNPQPKPSNQKTTAVPFDSPPKWVSFQTKALRVR